MVAPDQCQHHLRPCIHWPRSVPRLWGKRVLVWLAYALRVIVKLKVKRTLGYIERGAWICVDRCVDRCVEVWAGATATIARKEKLHTGLS